MWWLLVGMAAVLVGVCSASVQAAGVAPLGIASCVTGFALAGVLLAVASLFERVLAKNLVYPVLFATLLVIIAEHGWLYRDYWQHWQQVSLENPSVALFREEETPLPIHLYLQQEATPAKAAFWVFDGLIIFVTAWGIVRTWNRRYIQEEHATL